MRLKQMILGFIMTLVIGSTAVSLYGNDDHSETETIFFEETLPVEDKNIDSFIQISDNYPDEDSRAELFGEEKIIERLIAFNKNLNCNWDYYEITTQALQSKEFYSGDERFVKIYNRKGGQIKNQIITENEESHYVTSLNTIQMSKKAFDKYLPEIESGERFNDDDFVLSDSDSIPIILGYNYKAYTDIGEIMRLNYLQKDFEFCVKGFLPRESMIQLDEKIIELDNYICVPNFDCAEIASGDGIDFLFQIRYYLQRNSGYIKCDSESDWEGIDQKISNLAGQYGLDYCAIDSVYHIDTVTK